MMSRTPDQENIRRSYDKVAEDYADHLAGELSYKPLDRAILGALVEQSAPACVFADLGCGPGHVAAWLADRGVEVVGIDLSAKMVETGRRRFPKVEFREGGFLALPATEAEFGSIVAFYSIIHLHPAELPPAFAEMRRVLRPSGLALIAFHVGDEVRHRNEWWGHDVDIDFRFFEVGHIVSMLTDSGFEVEAQLERRNYPEEVETRRAYLLARRA